MPYKDLEVRKLYMREYQRRPERKERAKRIYQEAIKDSQFVESRRISVRSHYTEQKEALYKLLGSVCKHCGFSDKRALQIDHINGDGYLTNWRSGAKHGRLRFAFKRLLSDPEISTKLQILCANCNWIKRVENKEYYTGKTGLQHPVDSRGVTDRHA